MEIPRRSLLRAGLILSPLLLTGCRFGLNSINIQPFEDLDIDYKRIELDNGLLVHLSPNNSGRIYSNLLVNYGSINERRPGIAHLLEHVLFYSATEKFSLGVSEELEKRFQNTNASSMLEWFEMPLDALEKRLSLLLKFYSQKIFDTLLDENTIRKQKEAIIHEIELRMANPSLKDAELFDQKVYGEGHPLLDSYRSIGDPETIQEITREELREFYSKGFHPNLMHLVLVGRIPRGIERLIEKSFGNPPRGGERGIQIPKVKKTRKVIEIIREAPELQKGVTEIYLGFNTELTEQHKDARILAALNYFMGEDSNSRLFKKLRHELGMVYGAYSGAEVTPQLGEIVFSTQTSVDPKKVVEGIFSVMKSMKEYPIDLDEVERYNEQRCFRLAERQETGHGRRDLISWEIMNPARPGGKNSYTPVNPENIIEAARKYLPSQDEGGYVLMKRVGIREN